MLENKYVQDMTRERYNHDKELKTMNREVANKGKYAVQAAQYEEKIRFLEVELQSYKEKLKSYSGKDNQTATLSEQVEKLATEAEGFKKQCGVLKMKLDNRKKRIEFLRVENEKLFDQLKEHQKKAAQMKESA